MQYEWEVPEQDLENFRILGDGFLSDRVYMSKKGKQAFRQNFVQEGSNMTKL
jgi:hypothetical protein